MGKGGNKFSVKERFFLKKEWDKERVNERKRSRGMEMKRRLFKPKINTQVSTNDVIVAVEVNPLSNSLIKLMTYK